MGTSTDRFLGTSYVDVTLEALQQYATQLLEAGALNVIVGE